MDLPDPLLPLPDATIDLSGGVTPEHRLHLAFEQTIDHVGLHAIAWPAFDATGKLQPPPDEHVLHELAHSHEWVDETRLLINPRLGTVGVVPNLPDCDFCGDGARYDAGIEHEGRRTHAYLCPNHYAEHGSGTLGASGDAYLMLTSEVSRAVQVLCNQLSEAKGRQPAFEVAE